MLFVPTHSIVYNSHLHIGGVAFEVTPADGDMLREYGQIILTEADMAAAPVDAEASAADAAPKAKTTKAGGGGSNGNTRSARKVKARNR